METAPFFESTSFSPLAPQSLPRRVLAIAAHRDHELLFRAALVATRPLESSIEAIYVFDTASATEWGYPREFVPDTWVDISQTLEQKLSAMACYESDVRPYPHPRSLDALRHRG